MPNNETNVVQFKPPSSRAYQQKAMVFLEHHRNTNVSLAAGERLFVLSDRGIEEAPQVGPDNVMVITEQFGSWPVVCFAIPARHVEAWRRIDPEKSAPRMMARVRGNLGQFLANKDQGYA